VEPDLIDSYVTALRGRLGWRGDVDDIVDEMADHLHEHVEHLVARGEPHAEAQRHAVPGSSGSVQPVAWLVSGVAAVAGGYSSVLVSWSLRRYEIWVGTLTVAFALTTLTIAGVLLRTGRLRTGRLRTPSGWAVVSVGVLATAVTYPEIAARAKALRVAS
jgi:hypothetical protein